MTPKDIATAAALAVVVGVASFAVLSGPSPMALEKALAAGYEPTVMRRGGKLIAFRNEPDGGVSEMVVDHSPCAKAVKGDCHSTFKGIPTVPGNVMQPGSFAGADCVEVPCTIQAGDAPP